MLALSWESVFELYHAKSPESDISWILRCRFLELDSRYFLWRGVRRSCFT